MIPAAVHIYAFRFTAAIQTCGKEVRIRVAEHVSTWSTWTSSLPLSRVGACILLISAFLNLVHILNVYVVYSTTYLIALRQAKGAMWPLFPRNVPQTQIMNSSDGARSKASCNGQSGIGERASHPPVR